MTAREELEELAKACEECAGKDPESIDRHLEKCPACQEYKMKAEKINQTMEAMELLASKPEEERHKILSSRMEKFAEMPEEKRMMAINDMLDALEELSEEDRIKIVKTRTHIMTQLPKEKRDILMGTLKEIMTRWPEERKMMEKRAMMRATQDYFILKRMMIRMMFKRILS